LTLDAASLRDYPEELSLDLQGSKINSSTRSPELMGITVLP